jgi:hypothetical protein
VLNCHAEWTLQVRPDVVLDIQGSQSIEDAGKTLICNKNKCIIYGLNQNAIPSGVIALVSFKGHQGALGRFQIQLRDAIAVSFDVTQWRFFHRRVSRFPSDSNHQPPGRLLQL